MVKKKIEVEDKMQGRLKMLTHEIKDGASLLYVGIDKFNKKQDKKGAIDIDRKVWKLVCALGKVKQLVISKVPIGENKAPKEQIVSDKSTVKEGPCLNGVLYDLERELPLLSLVLTKLCDLLEKSEEAGGDLQISMGDLECLKRTLGSALDRIERLVYENMK